MDWKAIGTLNDIPPRGARTVETPMGQVAVFRTGADEVFALINKCPHRGGPLAEGIVSGRKVVCPMHNWVIDLNDGVAAAPDEGCTTTIPLRNDGGTLYLGLDTAKKVVNG